MPETRYIVVECAPYEGCWNHESPVKAHRTPAEAQEYGEQERAAKRLYEFDIWEIEVSDA